MVAFRRDQRTVFRQTDCTGSDTFRAMARPTPRRLPGRSVCRCDQISGREDRSAWQRRTAGRLVLRGANRYRWTAAFSQSEFDEAARRRWDAQRDYRRSGLLPAQGPGAVCTGSAWRAASAMSGPVRPIRRPIPTSAHGEFESTVGAQYFWFDRVFVWSADTIERIFQLLHPTCPARSIPRWSQATASSILAP